MGKLWHAHKDLNKAVEYYAESLKLNPFMWDAFLGLCETGKYREGLGDYKDVGCRLKIVIKGSIYAFQTSTS